jgi:hypothetical protein
MGVIWPAGQCESGLRRLRWRGPTGAKDEFLLNIIHRKARSKLFGKLALAAGPPGFCWGSRQRDCEDGYAATLADAKVKLRGF